MTDASATVLPAASPHQALLKPIQLLGDRVAWLYSDDGHLDHYQRLARTLEERFEDPALTAAAFVHGAADLVTSTDASTRASWQQQLGKSTLLILEEWKKLKKLDPLKKDFDSVLRREVFPKIKDPRSVLLLVYDCLDRIDPGGRFQDWSKQFRDQPPSSTPALPTGEGAGPTTKTSRLSFLQRVAAPIAELSGLWQERNLLRSAVLYHSRPQRFANLADFAHQAHLEQWGSGLADSIGKSLNKADRNRVLTVTWQWRHIASLDEQFGATESQQWWMKAHLAGFVTLLCKKPPDCYRLLGKLHRCLDYKLEFFRDSIGSPTPSGYRALHTVVSQPGRLERFIAVRLEPQERDRRRFELADRGYLETRLQESPTHTSEIRVFIKDGSYRYLPRGSRVLNLAAAIDKAWVPFVTVARVNGEHAEVLSPLSDGDSVWLEIVKELQILPEGWRTKVPEETIPLIEAGVEEGHQHVLAQAGREYLLRRIGLQKVDDSILDVFVESSVTELLESQPEAERHEVSWWIQQFGLLAKKDAGEELPLALHLDALQAEAIVEGMTRAAGNLQVWHSALDLDRQHLSTGVVRPCPECRPGPRSSLASEARTEAIIIHRRGERCARKALPFHRRHLTLDQVFFIESESMPGMARDLAAVFAELGVNVIELMARQLGDSWGVARIEVEPIGPRAIETLTANLSNLGKIYKVYRPGEEVPSILLNALPPRPQIPRSPLSSPPPFICGPVIYEDQYFYGRTQEVSELRQHLERADSRETPGGVLFVSGALKIGKTSLVQHFQRALDFLNQDRTFRYLSIYHKVAVGETWNDIERKLSAQITGKVQHARRFWQAECPELEGLALEELLTTLTSLDIQPTFAIAIDEAVRLFRQAQEDEEQVKQLQRITQLASQTPGILLVWIGPTAPVRNLRAEFQDLLASSTELRLKPLGVDATREMLSAKKLAGVHNIKVSEAVARSVHKLTAGNPFWIAHLGHEMWSQIERQDQPEIRFTEELLSSAAEELVQLGTPFQGRILPTGFDQEPDRVMLAVLFALVECGEPEGPMREIQGLTLQEIRSALSEKEIRTSSLVLERWLDELGSRGGVSRSGRTPTWKISSPLLRLYLRHLLERLGWTAVQHAAHREHES